MEVILTILNIELLENTIECNLQCLNGGICSPDTGKCICTTNCEGPLCETCHLEIPYLTILISIVSVVVLIFLVLAIKDYIQRKCR